LKVFVLLKGRPRTGHKWLTSEILSTQETEISRIMVRSQLGQIVVRFCLKKTNTNKITQKIVGGVVEGSGLEFKPLYPSWKSGSKCEVPL
jgi:hypothetical protein